MVEREKERKRLYEGLYIINATLSEDATKKALDKVKAEIEDRGGEVKKVFDYGRRRLAYEIADKKEGHYYILYFMTNASSIKELWREYTLNEDLLRFMNLQVDSIPESLEFKPLVVS